MWGRLAACGGLLIRLPPLDAPAMTAEDRHHSLRPAAMRGGLATCGRVGAPSGPGWRRLPIAAPDAIRPHMGS